MNNKYLMYISDLNHKDKNVRLESLVELKKGIELGEIEKPQRGNDVNNHIHTQYSFSPYSPSKAVWMANNAGLETSGIMDHDSISGAEEFIEAGKIMDMATTIGFECRADFSGTVLKGRRINNPDQKSIAYMAVHGIPHSRICEVDSFLAPYREERNKRNALMIGRINEIVKPYGTAVDFENDIKRFSRTDEGGSITERHILFGLSMKLIDRYGEGQALVDFIKNSLKLKLSSKVEKFLLDEDNPYYAYDLLGALKSHMVSMFYIDAHEECPDVKEVIKLSRDIGSISAYAYLGDVADSVTGDKKSEKFEDDYLELLFETITGLGFNAVTYMPSRNTPEQLNRIKSLCDRYSLLQISGEDINSPRQSFVCPAIRREEFSNLYDSTWALIGHERAATMDINKGMFSKDTIIRYPDLKDRIKAFKEIGLDRNYGI